MDIHPWLQHKINKKISRKSLMKKQKRKKKKKEQYKEHLGIVPSKLDSFTGLLI